MPAAAAERKQTFLHQVFTSFQTRVSSGMALHMSLHPAPGATYYLGSLSPDNAASFFYKLNRDDNRVRADAASFDKENLMRSWFTLPPNETRQMNPAIWMSNEEFVYPVKGTATRAYFERNP
jgi:hypothetical protein